MAVVYPPGDFTDSLYADSATGKIDLLATPPLSYVSATHTLSVGNASAASAGVVTTGAQSLAGIKTFTSVPVCAVAPVTSAELANKGYVDTMAMGMSWQKQVIAFHDLGSAYPSPLATGDRYIASATGGDFFKNFIYEWNGSAWIEIIPKEGAAVYVTSDTSPQYANECIVYSGTAWVSLGSSLTHQSLIGAGTLTHATIDGYLNQAVRTTSSPSFASMAITNTTSSTAPTTGALTVGGGVGILENLYVGGLLRVTDPTETSTTLTGCATFAGGVGIAGALRVGNFMQSSSRFEVLNATEASSMGGSIRTNGGISAIKGGYFGGNVVLASTTASTSSATGALTVAGGVGIGDAAYIGGVIESGPITTRISAAGDSASFLYPGASIGGSSVSIVIGKSNAADEGIRLGYKHQTAGSSSTYLSLGIIGREGMRINGARNTQFTGGVSTAGALTVQDTTASTAATTGALTVAGGVGIAGNEYVGGLLRVTDATASTSSSTGAAVITGGVGIGGSANVGGNLTVTGSVNASINAQSITGKSLTLGDFDAADTMIVRCFAGEKQIRLESVMPVKRADTTYAAYIACDPTAMRIYGMPLHLGADAVGDNAAPVSILDETESTSSDSGSLVVLGGVGIAKNLTVGGVIKCGDVATLNGAYGNIFTTSKPTQTVYVTTIGNLVFVSARSDSTTETTVSPGTAIYDTAIASAYRPASHTPTTVFYNCGGAIVQGMLVITTAGEIQISGPSQIPMGQLWYVSPWSVCYHI